MRGNEHATPGEQRDDALANLFQRLGSSAKDTSGAWRLETDDQDVGVVLMERGRVCWAVTKGGGRRLTDLLVTKHGVSREVIEQVYDECRAANVPIGERLVERGALRPDALESALMEHTAEAVSRLGSYGPTRATWVAHRHGSYSPRFTFPLSQVILQASAHSYGEQISKVRARIEKLSEPGTPLIAFDARSARGLPLAIHGIEIEDVDALLSLGSFAARLSSRLDDRSLSARVISATGTLGSLVVVEEPTIRLVALCTSTSSMARMLAKCSRGNHGDL